MRRRAPHDLNAAPLPCRADARPVDCTRVGAAAVSARRKGSYLSAPVVDSHDPFDLLILHEPFASGHLPGCGISLDSGGHLETASINNYTNPNDMPCLPVPCPLRLACERLCVHAVSCGHVRYYDKNKNSDLKMLQPSPISRWTHLEMQPRPILREVPGVKNGMERF